MATAQNTGCGFRRWENSSELFRTRRTGPGSADAGNHQAEIKELDWNAKPHSFSHPAGYQNELPDFMEDRGVERVRLSLCPALHNTPSSFARTRGTAERA